VRFNQRTTCCGDHHSPGDWQYFEAPDPFEVTLGGENSRSACIDVSAPEGEWTVTVIDSGGRGLSMALRDSIAPGDLCLNESYDGTTGDVYPLGGQPSSHVNACGTDWGELIRDEDDELRLEMYETDEENPLAFIVRVGGSPKAETTIKVDIKVNLPPSP
jgi:hypothetical protein